jgi:hypothetical protein
MISFRVSADDAPILAKQFEPQFEPNDLLQMHNRNFVINMVIKGEKSPAFNATTLTLPTPQIDNTGRIIENTRRNYSRPRSEIEEEISAAIRIPEALQRPPVQRQQPKWTTTPKPNTEVVSLVGQRAISPTPVVTEVNTEAPIKRKRPRNRKRKPINDGQYPNSQATANRPQTGNNDDTFQIKH